MPLLSELFSFQKVLANVRRIDIRSTARFRFDRSGAAAVEMALVAAPFLALLVAAVQLGLVYLSQSALEIATEKTARPVLTGAAQTAGLTQQQFLSSICANLPAILNCSNVMVDAQVYSTFSSANTSMPTITYDNKGNVSNKWLYNLGGANSIVVIRVMYLLPVIGALSFNVANQQANKILLLATAVVKNEPYQ